MNRATRLTLVVVALVTTVPANVCGGEPVRIMPLGDSITQSDRRHNSYRRNLWHRLQAGGYHVDFVGSQTEHFGGAPPNPDFDLNHEGHWGWRVDQILKRIDEWAAIYHPDVVLIHLGHNDIFQGDSVHSTIQELGHVIDILRDHNHQVTILLAQLIPTHPPYYPIDRLNAEIPQLAKLKHATKSPVIIVNQADGFKARTDTYDGVHPNETGEEKMASRWYTAIAKTLRKPTDSSYRPRPLNDRRDDNPATPRI
jgi:lysophospholipase L1-like esterase